MRTVDITPQWQGVWRLLAEVATNGTTHDGRRAAVGELARMAEMADAYGEAWKNGDHALRDALTFSMMTARAGGSRSTDEEETR